MKFVLVSILLLACGSAAKAQSCLTPADIRSMLARIDSPPPAKPDKKLKEELIKIANKQRELLLRVVDNNQTKQSDNEKLNKLYEDDTPRLCQILTTYGWPTTALVDREGLFAAFYILKNGSYELQRDLLPVIVAAMKKDPAQKPDFAALIDRLRVSAGMKQPTRTSDSLTVIF